MFIIYQMKDSYKTLGIYLNIHTLRNESRLHLNHGTMFLFYPF